MKLTKKTLYIASVTALVGLMTQAHATPVLYGLGNTSSGTVNTDDINLYQIDVTTGAATLVGATGFNLRGLAFNPLTGRAYASIAEVATGGGLYEINLSTGAATFIGGTQSFQKMEFDGSGNLLGYDSRQQGYNFYKINVNTGIGTLLNPGALSINNHALFDIAYSSADNQMYLYQQWFQGSGGEGLGTVNTANGTVTPLVSGSYQPFRPDIAVDDNSNFYAIDRATGFTSLYSLNTATGNTTLIGSSGVGLHSIAFAGGASVPDGGATTVLLGLALSGIAAARRKAGAA